MSGLLPARNGLLRALASADGRQADADTFRGVRDVQADGADLVLHLSRDEVIVLHEALSRAEWADDLGSLALESEAERRVVERLMLALRPAVPALGTNKYGEVVRAASLRLTTRPDAE